MALLLRPCRGDSPCCGRDAFRQRRHWLMWYFGNTLVPTLRVGMLLATLRVVERHSPRCARTCADAERRNARSHAERVIEKRRLTAPFAFPETLPYSNGVVHESRSRSPV